MNKTGKWARRAVWATFAAVLAVGCNPLTTIAFIFHKDSKIPAQHPLPPKTDEDGKKKDEVKVAVFCQFAQNPPRDFVTADRELVGLIVKRFPDMLKGSGGKEKIVIVATAEVDKFKMANPNWKSMHPADWGKKLGADYVLDISLAAMQIYQPGSNSSIYEGTAEVTVDVYDTDKGRDAPRDHYVHPFTYPRGVGMARDVSEMPVSRFKQMYLEKLAYDIILMHIEHKATEGIASDQ
jgi:hypothetical protein